MPSNFIAQCFLMGHPMKSVFSLRAVSNANTEIHHAVPCFFCLALWEQFPCFSRQISWMPLCNVFFSVLIFDLYYFSLLYKDNNLHTIIIVWNFIVVFYTVCFLKSFILVCVLSKLYSMLYFAFKFLYQSVCIPDCSLCVFKFISKIVC